MKAFGIKLKQLRESSKISQAALSYELNVSQTTISNIESGNTKGIDLKIFYKVCNYFKKDFNYFFEPDNQNINDDQSLGNVIIPHDNDYFPLEELAERIRVLISENKLLKIENMRLKEKLDKTKI